MAKGRAIGFGIENLPRIVRGEGSYLIDDAGRRYLDGSGGPAAFCIGHANREINAAIAAQLDQVACGYRSRSRRLRRSGYTLAEEKRGADHVSFTA